MKIVIDWLQYGLLTLVAYDQKDALQLAFSSHGVQHINGALVTPMENPAGRFNDLAIAPAAQFLWFQPSRHALLRFGMSKYPSVFNCFLAAGDPFEEP